MDHQEILSAKPKPKMKIKITQSLRLLIDAIAFLAIFGWGYFYISHHIPTMIQSPIMFFAQLTPAAVSTIATGLCIPILLIFMVALYIRRMIESKKTGIAAMLNHGDDNISELENLSVKLQQQIDGLNNSAQTVVERGFELRQTLVQEGDRIERTGERILTQQHNISQELQGEIGKMEHAADHSLSRAQEVSAILHRQEEEVAASAQQTNYMIEKITGATDNIKQQFHNVQTALDQHSDLMEQSGLKIGQKVDEYMRNMQQELQQMVEESNNQLISYLDQAQESYRNLSNDIGFGGQEVLNNLRQAGEDGRQKIEEGYDDWRKEMARFIDNINDATKQKRDEIAELGNTHKNQLHDFIAHINQQGNATKNTLDTIAFEHRNLLDEQINIIKDNLNGNIKEHQEFLNEKSDNFKNKLQEFTDNQQLSLQESSDYHARRIEDVLGQSGDAFADMLTRLDSTGKALITRLDETIEQNSTSLNDLNDSLKAQAEVLDSALASAEMRVENMSFSLNKQSQTLITLASNLSEQNKQLGGLIGEYTKNMEQSGEYLVTRVDGVVGDLNRASADLDKSVLNLEKYGDGFIEQMNHNNQILMNGNDRLTATSEKFDINIRQRQQELLESLRDAPQKTLAQFDETMIHFNSLVNSLKEQGVMIQRSGEWAAAQARETEKSSDVYHQQLQDSTQLIEDSMTRLQHMLKEQNSEIIKVTDATTNARTALEDSLREDINALDNVANKLLQNTVETQGKLRHDIQEMTHFNERLEHQQQRLFSLLTDQLNSVRESLEQVRNYLAETGQTFRERAHDMRSNMDQANQVMIEAGERLDKGVQSLISVSSQSSDDFNHQSDAIEGLSDRLSKAAGQVSSTMHLVQNVMIEQGTMLEHSAKTLSGELDPLLLRLEHQSEKLQSLLQLGSQHDIETMATQIKNTIESLHRDTAFALGAVKDMSVQLSNVGHKAIDNIPRNTQPKTPAVTTQTPKTATKTPAKTDNQELPSKASTQKNLEVSKRFMRELGSQTATIAGLLSTKLSDSDWQKYQQGDYEALARIMMRRGNRNEIANDITKDTQLQRHVDSFINQYQSVINQARDKNKDTVLSQMLETSAFGRLYNSLKKMMQNANVNAA